MAKNKDGIKDSDIRELHAMGIPPALIALACNVTVANIRKRIMALTKIGMIGMLL